MKQYENFVSLGYFCSPALELERTGLRSVSLPFDWLITDFHGVRMAIETHFEDFLNYDHMLQCRDNHAWYYDEYYKFHFIHDFNAYDPLKDQLPAVREKYARRIERFFQVIQTPTLFVRYISNEPHARDANGRSEEMGWLEQHGDEFLELLRSFHPENDIIWIANSDVTSDTVPVWPVEIDDGDTVARVPFEKNRELGEFFASLDYPARAHNLEVYRAKQQRKQSKTNQMREKFAKLSRKVISKEYVHSRQY